MKWLWKIAAGLFCLIGAAHAETVAPDELIKATVQDVLTIVKQDKDIQAGDRKKILELVDAKVLPHFDFTRMTQLAVGKNWRSATPAQKQALVTEFRNMLVRTYTRAFTQYSNQSVEMKPFKMEPDATEATVKTSVVKPGAQPILVDYEMRKTQNGWKAFDISIDGVSMVLTYRGTFDSEVQQNGIDGLIKMLSSKNASAGTDTVRKADAKDAK